MIPTEQPVVVHPTSSELHYIYEYPSGRRILIAIEHPTGRPVFVREL